MKRAVCALFLMLCFTGIFPLALHAQTGIIHTKHNLSITGPGEIKALTEDRICVFCHTPHNAAPRTPLWTWTVAALLLQPPGKASVSSRMNSAAVAGQLS